MKVAAGTLAYSLGKMPCAAEGRSLSTKELDAILNERIGEILLDIEGGSEVEEMMSGHTDSVFSRENLRAILAQANEAKNWRVGEALASVYLADHRDCFFPWPASRDARRTAASLPGADLVGMRPSGNSDVLVFGEVKTSAQKKYPPDVMFGKTGLTRQLDKLRSSKDVRNELFA